jgi:RluA family pseudouridine synthase
MMNIIWADDHLLAVNKPAGLPTLPDGWAPGPHVKSVLEPIYGRLWIVHRLDRSTSGALVLARTAAAHRDLNLQFDAHAVAKIYHALVVGSPAWEEQVVDLPLRADGDRKHRTIVDPRRGKPSVTGLRVLEQLGAYTLVEARPATGRTHQIRAHLVAVGFPIAGDALYGGAPVYRPASEPGRPTAESLRPLLDRPALHARSLTLRHPATGDQLTFEASYPDDLAAALDELRNFIYALP